MILLCSGLYPPSQRSAGANDIHRLAIVPRSLRDPYLDRASAPGMPRFRFSDLGRETEYVTAFMEWTA